MKSIIFKLHTASCVLLLYSLQVSAAPSVAVVVKYLQQYGYLQNTDPKVGNIMSATKFTEAVKSFQKFSGLRESGTLDDETLQKIDEPRCGNSDVIKYGERKRRFILQGSKWHAKNLTYRILSYTADLLHHETEKAFEDAFKMWIDVSALKFSKQKTSAKSDIEIQFVAREHGDEDPFDGRGKTLAHAFFPQFGGMVHFDEEEKWQMDSSEGGTNLKLVAAHELGHSLGLSHSNVKGALMNPHYSIISQNNQLHEDDVTAIQLLYGKPEKKIVSAETETNRPIFTRPPTRPPATPFDSCNGRFDAITSVHNGSTFAFKGNFYWRIGDMGMDQGYPRTIRQGWEFDGQIDAALTFEEFTDFFLGSQVRRFVNGIPLPGYPKSISKVYSGIPAHIDAAFVWSGNRRLYFMKGDKYWRYNPYTRKTDIGYPKSTQNWKGLPSRIDAALQWKDGTYFFKEGYYWRVKNNRVEVAQSFTHPYPRRSDEWWLRCKDNTLTASFVVGSDKKAEENNSNGGRSKFTVQVFSFHIMTITTFILFSGFAIP